MASILDTWPRADPLTAGDAVILRVTINTTADITAWQWSAKIRPSPREDAVAEFDIDLDPGNDHRLILRLTGDQSALLHWGYGFDLRQTSPIEYTWLSVSKLNVIPSYSRAEA